MSNESKLPPAIPASVALPESASAAVQNAWTLNFNAPKPPVMPADRLRARAELVRAAMTCGGTC